jgi:hypothetical protein
MRRYALVLAALFFVTAAHAQGPRPAGPAPEGLAAPPAVPQPEAPPGMPRTTRPENLTTFDYRVAELQWVDSRWVLRAGDVVLKDFGKREAEARQALRIIRELRLTEHATVGTPRPVLEYWLADGQAPRGLSSGLQLLPIDPSSMNVEQIQGQWCLRDARRPLFSFGPHQDDANHALEVMRRYGFNRVGYVGQPVPAMIYFLAESNALPSLHRSLPSPLMPRPLFNGGQAAPGQEAGTAPPGGPEQNPPRPGRMASPLELPSGRQFTATNTRLPGVEDLGDRVPFDYRQVQMRHDTDGWKLVLSNYVLADLGKNESEARHALAVVQFYHFTEQCLVGQPQPTFTYFLVNGQAPRGVMFGVNIRAFRPSDLSLRQEGTAYVIYDGTQPLLNFGDKKADAEQLLKAIHKYKFDHLCRVGQGEPHTMTFLVRTR